MQRRKGLWCASLRGKGDSTARLLTRASCWVSHQNFSTVISAIKLMANNWQTAHLLYFDKGSSIDNVFLHTCSNGTAGASTQTWSGFCMCAGFSQHFPAQCLAEGNMAEWGLINSQPTQLLLQIPEGKTNFLPLENLCEHGNFPGSFPLSANSKVLVLSSPDANL